MADWELLTKAPHRLHEALRARHAQRHPVSAPANVAHHERLSLLDHVALLITDGVGTMWCALAFTALSLVSLPAALATGSLIVIVGWIAQTFLQLVLLSIIMVGQRLQSRADELKAEADHETLQRVLALLEAQQPATSRAPARSTRKKAG